MADLTVALSTTPVQQGDAGHHDLHTQAKDYIESLRLKLDFVRIRAATTGAVALDLADSVVKHQTLTGNVTYSIAATGVEAGGTGGLASSFTLILKQDATGGRLVTWPSSIKWPGGVAPTLSTAANAEDILTFLTFDGGVSWYGFLAGKDFR